MLQKSRQMQQTYVGIVKKALKAGVKITLLKRIKIKIVNYPKYDLIVYY